MKVMKTKIILLAIIIIMLSYYFKFGNQSKANSPPTVSANQEQFQLADVDNEKIKKRQEELKHLQNPQFIEQNLKQVGKLIIFESQYHYTDNPTEKGIFGITLRQIHIDFLYRFGLGIDLEDVEVTQIVSGKIVYIKIPENKIKLQFIEMINDQSTLSDGKKFFLVKQFKPSETDMIINQCQQNVVNKIGFNQSYFELAEKNLESELNKLVLKMGYSQAIFV